MAKFEFHRAYQGPRGAHLNHLTKYTLTKERKVSGSMHPAKVASGRSVQRSSNDG